MDKFKLPKLPAKRQLTALIITALILISIPAGVYLSQNKQIIKSRAVEVGDIYSQCTEDHYYCDNGRYIHKTGGYLDSNNQCQYAFVDTGPCPSITPTTFGGPDYNNWVFTMRELGIYPEVENGEVMLYDRAGYERKHGCNEGETCLLPAPTNLDYINTVYQDKELITTLFGELIIGMDGKRYRPLFALMPYFQDELENIIPSYLLNDPDFIERGGILYNSLLLPNQNGSEFYNDISPEELRKFITKALNDKGLARLDTQQSFRDPFTALITLTDPFFGTQAIVNVFTKPPHRVSDNDRLNTLIGMSFIMYNVSSRIANQSIAIFSNRTLINNNRLIQDVSKLRQDLRVKPTPLRIFQRDKVKGWTIQGRLPRIIEYGAQYRFADKTVAGRQPSWQAADLIIGPPPKDRNGNFLVGEFLERDTPVPKPHKNDHQGMSYYRSDVLPAINQRMALPVSTRAVLQPVIENTIWSVLNLETKLNRKLLTPEAERIVNDIISKGTVFVIPECSLSIICGGYQAGFVTVINIDSYLSPLGLAVLHHEYTHFIHKAITQAYRIPNMTFEYRAPINGQIETWDQYFSVLYEIGTDINSDVAMRARNVNGVLNNYDIPSNYRSAYTKYYPAVKEKIEVIFRDFPQVEDYLREFALTGDSNNLVARFNNLLSYQNYLRRGSSGSSYQDFFDYFRFRGINFANITPIAATGTGLTNYDTRPVGPQFTLNSDFFGVDQETGTDLRIVTTTPPPTRSVTNVFINWNGSGGTDIINVNGANLDGLTKGRLCNGNSTDTIIHVKYSSSPNSNSYPLKIKGDNTWCSQSDDGGTQDTFLPPTNLSYQCLGNNQARISWNGTGAAGYDVRVNNTKDPWTPRSSNNGPDDFFLDNIGPTELQFTIEPNTQYEYWVHSFTFSGGNRKTSTASDKKHLSCPSASSNIIIQTPVVQKASCNQTTLNLSWIQVPGITKYQMRGRKTTNPNYSPTLPNGNPDPNWLNGLNTDPNAKEVLTNGDGSNVSCYSNLCSYSFSGLSRDFSYKIWVNAIDSGGNKSRNAYVEPLVSCQPLNFGTGLSTPPSNITASCTNGNLRIEWDNPIGNYSTHIRGLKTDDPNYYPPLNWTDGIDPSRIVSNGAGSNVVCNNSRCSYQDNTTRTGNYRIWLDAFNQSVKSNNTYVNGLINCR